MMSHKFLLNKYLLTILVLVIIFPLNVFARVTPTREFFVNDYANVLSYETCKYLQESSEELYKIDGYIPFLNGYDFKREIELLKEYAKDAKMIRVWSSHLNCDEYCLLLYICYLQQF